jgi:hypothetical protein
MCLLRFRLRTMMVAVGGVAILLGAATTFWRWRNIRERAHFHGTSQLLLVSEAEALADAVRTNAKRAADLRGYIESGPPWNSEADRRRLMNLEDHVASERARLDRMRREAVAHDRERQEYLSRWW